MTSKEVIGVHHNELESPHGLHLLIRTLDFTKDGKALIYATSDGQVFSIDVEQVVSSVEGTDGLDKQNLSLVYPNPADSEINIVTQEVNFSPYTIRIYNTLGQLQFYRSDVNSNNLSVNIDHLPKGLYFINISYNNNVQETLKFIKN